MEQQLQRACKQTKSKQKQNQVLHHIQIGDLVHKQCNGVIKGWHHRLTSVSKRRILVNNMVMFGSALAPHPSKRTSYVYHSVLTISEVNLTKVKSP